MAKQKKRRNKKYSGKDAAASCPSITKITAVNRSKTSQWLFDRRQLLKPAGIVIAVVLMIILILSGIFRLF